MRADPARRSSRIAAFLMLVVGIQIATAPVGAGSSEEVSKARSEREALQRRLDAAVEQYERAQSRLASTKEAAAVAQTRLREAEGRLRGIRAVLSKRASITYRRGRVGIVSVLLDSKRIGDFARRLVLLQRAAGLDSAALVQAGRARAEIAERKGDLESRRQDQHRIVGHLRALTSELTGRFRQAQALETKLVAERRAEQRRRQEAARRAALAGELALRASFSPGGAFACPVDGPRAYRDSWGERRSGGRRHRGVDIHAARGTPAAAVVDGTILRMTRSGLGGITLYLRGYDGSEYFYAHLKGYGSISAGQRVPAGAHIAFVGNSGNARRGPNHLHFEIHPRGGPAINPYPIVRAACG